MYIFLNIFDDSLRARVSVYIYLYIYVWMCVRSCVHVNSQRSVQCFVCRTISEHLGAVQVNRQEGEAAFKKRKKERGRGFTGGRGECRLFLCGGGG